jgi:DNA-binding transcriptional ArsR family regulator
MTGNSNTRSGQPGDSDLPLESFCQLLKLASNPNRLRILIHLHHGEYAVGDIESTLGLKQPNLSHELRKLRDHGLVESRRQSKVVFYSLTAPAARLLDGIRQLMAHLSDEEDMRVSAVMPDWSRHTVPDRSIREQGECGHFSVVYQGNPTSNPEPLT